MRRGEVYIVDLEPTTGSEAAKQRPAILVSNDAANRAAERDNRGVVSIVPITSNTARVYPFQVLLRAGDGGLNAKSKAQAEQVRSVDVSRLSRRLGAIAPAALRQLDDALRLHLSL